ncbi:NisI/SpaI family lantibiotic immunity lipoprotein [Paenibacillus lactis]|uniref:NisI/SpaI family lantibiotic immunity lipoprotein n=1 Tax=Paenibacillus lactis TaxID=228574 RepID=UPI0036A0C651
MKNTSKGWILFTVSALLLLTGCERLEQFTQKVVEETQKTAHYTLELDEETDLTIEQLIDEGRLDRLVFDGRLYELQGEADPESKGGHIGFIGETYYVDQEGKRWTEDELKNPYLYLDPKDIREKSPMTYGSVYRHKGEPKGSSNRIIIELNRKVLEAELVREE